MKRYINSKLLKGAGKVSSININSFQKIIRCSFDLEGEKEPINAEIAYSLDQSTADGPVLRLKTLKASRAWIETVFNRFVPKEQLAIPLPKSVRTAMELAGLV